MITIHAPEGIAEITPDSDLAAEIAQACAASALGGLRDGDLLVVTSKIVSKQEGRLFAAEEKLALRRSETVRTVARKMSTAIVATHHGLVQAAAGIDASNVATGTILALPVDPDASAVRLRTDLAGRSGANVGIVISDTAGRAWRVGQTDHAIGCAGVNGLISYAGQHDAHGNELRVTLTAIADELAAAGDLAKGKLGGRPVAVIRGLAHLVTAPQDPGQPARDIARPVDEDLFSHGSRESVLVALLLSVDAQDRYEELVELDDPAQVVDALGLTGDQRGWALAVLSAAQNTFG